MPRIMKPPTNFKDDTDTGGEFYDGEPPKPGLYKGKVKMLLLSMAKNKEGQKEQRIMVLCEITEGKYKGAGVTKWLQLTKQGAPWLNQFLRSLTDGSDAQFKGIRDAFWDIGYEVGEMDAKKRLPIVKIGKRTNPIGMTTSFMTKLRPGTDDVVRAEISRFVTPVAGGSAGDDDDETVDDDLEEFANDPSESDSDTEVDDDSSEEVATEDDGTEEDSSGDESSDEEGDPWSV